MAEKNDKNNKATSKKGLRDYYNILTGNQSINFTPKNKIPTNLSEFGTSFFNFGTDLGSLLGGPVGKLMSPMSIYNLPSSKEIETYKQADVTKAEPQQVQQQSQPTAKEEKVEEPEPAQPTETVQVPAEAVYGTGDITSDNTVAPTGGLKFDSSYDNVANVVSSIFGNDNSNTQVNTGEKPPVLRGMAPTGQVAEQQAQQGLTNDAIMQQLLSAEGYVTPEQMKNMIADQYAQMRAINNQNPYYGGQYIQPQGYDIDLDRYKNLQQLDYYRKLAGGGTTDLAQTYADMQKNLFNQQMAQQAGVPYEDYVKGMADRNTNEVLIRAKEAEQQVANYANQTNDMKTKLAAVQQIMQIRENAKNKIAEIQAEADKQARIEDIKGKYGVINTVLGGENTLRNTALQNVGNLNVERYKQENPVNKLYRIAQAAFNFNVAYMGDPEKYARQLASLPVDVQRSIFGRVMTLDETRKFAGAVGEVAKSNPNAFREFLDPSRYGINLGF